MEWIDKEKVIEVVEKYKDVIVGLKVRMSKSVVCDSGIELMYVVCVLFCEILLLIMVYIGLVFFCIEEVVFFLEKDDVIIYYLNGKENNLFDEEGKLLFVLLDVVNCGVYLDVGYGNVSFFFKVVEVVKCYDIVFYIISMDIYWKNCIYGLVYSMVYVFLKFFYLGYLLEEVIDVVMKNVVEWFKKLEFGCI